MDRRVFLATSLTLLAPRARAARPLRLALLGQALIEHPLPAHQWPARDEMERALKGFEVCFTNLETVIKGPRAGAPTRDALTVHAATPAVVDTLKALNVNLLATSNNHAFDLGSGGILDTIDTLRTANMVFAGTGATLADAAAPAVSGDVALVACATGKIREGGAATASRPGVNEVRRGADTLVGGEDLARVREAIAAAKSRARVVIAYHHNHDWEPDESQVPGWQRAFARHCIDAGASVFVGHGVPLLQGVEIYKTAPILYGLGNFIFQTEKPVGAYGAAAWRSVIAECAFDASRCTAVTFRPIVLNEVGLGGPDDMVTRGAPRLASPEEAAVILDGLAAASTSFGTRIARDGALARLVL